MKNKISNIINHNYNTSIKLLIEAFVLYYGEEYRDIITYRLMHTYIFIYYNENTPTENFLEQPTYEKDLNKEMRKNNKGFFSFNSERKTKNRIIWTNADDDVINRKITDKGFIRNLKRNSMIQISTIMDNEYENYILLPLFLSNDQTIIHELIHSLMRQLIGIHENGYAMGKCGYILHNNKYFPSGNYLEESITEYEAKLIYKIFKSLNGNIINDFAFHEEQGCLYDKTIPYIIDFYELFKSDIIYSRITLNKNHIYGKVGKEVFEAFSTLLNEMYYSFEEFDDLPSEFIKTIYIEPIIKKMTSHSEKEFDYDIFYKDLEKAGYKIRKLQK